MKVPFAVCAIAVLFRASFIPQIADLMWSDPEDIDTWAVSPRGAGWLFGGNVTQEVYKLLLADTLNLPLTTIVQSHE